MDVLNATAGASNANAYCSLAEATLYNDNHIGGAAWALAAPDQQTRAILTATRLIDEHYAFAGLATTFTQALKWPRSGLLDVKGAPIPYTEVPTKVKEATAEFARQLLSGDRTVDDDVAMSGITSFEATGAIKVTFKDGIQSKVIPDAVSRMLAPWGAKTSGPSTGRDLIRQ
jgi:hypothetical protein